MVYAEEPEEYITFCIHECRKEIEKYIDFRVRNGEKIKGSAQLIREKFDRNNTSILSKSKRLKIDAYYKFIQQALEVDYDTRKKEENLTSSGRKEEKKQNTGK